MTKYEFSLLAGLHGVNCSCCAVKPLQELPVFFEPTDLGSRNWGVETLLGYSPGKWMIKLIKMKKGCYGGLQYHRIKDEGGFILSGTLIIRFASEGQLIEKSLSAGNSFRFPPGCIHQEIAVTDVEIVEVSTPHLNDRVRVEEYFGLPKDSHNSLETTELSQIQVL